MVEQRTFNPWVLGSSPRRPTRLTWKFAPFARSASGFELQFRLRLARIRPQCLADEPGGLSGERVGGLGVDPGSGDLGVAEDALDHVYIDVLLSQQRAGGAPGAVQPGVLSNAGFGEQCLLLFPVVVRVDRLAFRPAPDKIPVLPGVFGVSPFGVLVGEVLA
jgi:hypothetical protein